MANSVYLLDRHYMADGQHGTETSKAFGSVAKAMEFIRADIIKYLVELRVLATADKSDPKYGKVMGWLNGQCVDDMLSFDDNNFDMNADDPDYATWNIALHDNDYWCIWTLHHEEVIE